MPQEPLELLQNQVKELSADLSALSLDQDDSDESLNDISLPSSIHNSRPVKRAHQSHKRVGKWARKGKSLPIGETCHLLDLPDEVLRSLLVRLPPRGLKSLGETCSLLRHICQDEGVWRECFVNRYLPDSVSGSVKAETKVLVQGCLGDERGWKRECLVREAMQERWTVSKTQPAQFQQSIGLIHSLSLHYPLPIPPRPRPLIVGKTHPTPTKTATPPSPSSSETPNSVPSKMTHRQKYEALLAATTRPPPYIMSAGLEYGAVIRSDPMTGKVSSGFWGPSRDANLHLRPHLDHSAPPSALFIPPRDQSFVLWGLLTGTVAHTSILTKHPSSPGSRAHSVTLFCDSGQAHDSEINDVFASADRIGPLRFVSAGADGRVKYWQVETGVKASGKRTPTEIPGSVTCLFSSRPPAESLPNRSDTVKLRQSLHPDSIDLARCDKDVVCGVTEDGDLQVWWDLEDGRHKVARIDVGAKEDHGGVKSLELDVRYSEIGMTISVLIHHRNAPMFSKWTINADPAKDHVITETQFAMDHGSAITCVKAFLTPSRPISQDPTAPLPPILSGEASSAETTPDADNLPNPIEQAIPVVATGFGRLVVTGDREGCASIWAWTGDDAHVKPMRAWRATDRAITAVDYHCGLIAVGSCDGFIKVYDPLPDPPTLLRTFRASHLSSADTATAMSGEPDAKYFTVNNILLENDLLVASIGRKVFAWRAGQGKRWNDGKGKKGKGGIKGSGSSKIVDMRSVQQEAVDTINEDELASTPSRTQRREMVKMQQLGLDDGDEALQYALMLSMEEGDTSLASTSSSRASNPESDEDVRAVEAFQRKEEDEMKEIMEMIRQAEERDRRTSS